MYQKIEKMISEATNLRVSDIMSKEMKIRVRNGYGEVNAKVWNSKESDCAYFEALCRVLDYGDLPIIGIQMLLYVCHKGLIVKLFKKD